MGSLAEHAPTATLLPVSSCEGIAAPGNAHALVAAAGAVSFLTAFGVGANDVANAFATSVGSGAISLRAACVIAAVCEFSGATLMGSAVTRTLKGKIVDPEPYDAEPERYMLGMIAVMGATFLWLILATWFKLPVSTTHTVFGGLVGYALCTYSGAVQWGALGKVAISWLTAPGLAGPCGAALFFLLRRYVLRHSDAFLRARRALPLAAYLTLAVGVSFLFLTGVPALRELFGGLHPLLVVLTALTIALAITTPFAVVLVPRLTRSVKETDPATYPWSAEQASGHREMHFLSEDPPEAQAGGAAEGAGDAAADPGDPPADGAADEEEAPTSPAASAPADTEHVAERRAHAEHFDPQAEALFRYLQVVSGCFASFAHGANDTANAIGPFTAVWGIYRSAHPGNGTVEGLSSGVPMWVLVLGGVGIVLGLSVWGWRIIESMGKQMCLITPTRGFAIQTASALMVIVCSAAGIPVSSTHCQIGSTVGVGLTEGRRDAVNWALLTRVALGWVATIVVAAGTTAGIYAALAAALC
eukprot:TRINITY_DN8578_c0_g1_i1.p1 TRINITY_DN8578_c0_g1~~TRINITY_DN8578_c0_g1_i1.p1  ORF type:complete len:552 (+),score=169.52 TRINITY_DN8578_c0_g1_i1:68-1657(+)